MARRDGLLPDFDMDIPDTRKLIERVPVTNPIPVPGVRGRPAKRGAGRRA